MTVLYIFSPQFDTADEHNVSFMANEYTEGVSSENEIDYKCK